MPSKVMGISPELKTLHKIFPVVDFTIYKEYNGFMRFESTGTYSHKFTVICFDLIQTKSSAPITFISEDESLYTVKSVQVTKDGDIYKHQIEVTYDGEKLEQKSYKETSTITVRQEGNDKYEGETITFQVKITQNILFWAKVLPYDYSKGTVSCEIGEKLPPGYIIDSDTSGSLFTFTPKKGYCVADVKINGESQGAITSYRVTNDKNYLIEVFFEPSSVAKSVKVTLSVENEGGVITPKGEQFIDYGGSIKFNVTLKDGYAFKKYRIKNSESDKTHSIPAGYLNYESTISNICSNTTIQFWFNKWHKLYWDYNEGEGAIKVNFKNGNKQKNGEYIEVTEDSEYLIYIMPSEGYKIKSVKLGDVDITKKVENDVYKLPSTPIMSDTKFSVTFEKETIAKYIVKVFYDEGGVVKVNNRLIADGSSTSVTASTDVRLSIVPNQGYHLKSVTIGWIDKTSEVISNQLTISSISKNQEISILFEKDAPVSYIVKVSYNEGGTVKVNNNKVDNGTSTTVTASTNVQLSIVPNSGYHLKSVTVGGVDKTSEVRNNQLTITSISKNQEISILFEKDASINYTVKVSYNEGGKIKVNNNFVDNGTITTVTVPADVQLSVVPDKGYHLKQIMVGSVDKTNEVKENQLFFYSISENLEVSVAFEKDVPTSYFLTIFYKDRAGTVKVNGVEASHGQGIPISASSTEFIFLPAEGYRLKKAILYYQVMEVSYQDITEQIKNNRYTLLSSTSDLRLDVEFEQIPFFSFQIEGGAGLIKIDNEIVLSNYYSYMEDGSSTIIQILDSKYSEIDEVLLNEKNITSKINNGFLKIESIESDTKLNFKWKSKQYILSLTDIQNIEKIYLEWDELPVQKNIQVAARKGFPLTIYSNKFYSILKVLLDGESVYEADPEHAIYYAKIISMDMDKDKELTVILKLEEERSLTLDVKEPGTLSSYLSEEDIKLVTNLHLQGNIDQRDFVVMNQMESLSDLDITATVNKYIDYPANEIPKKAFYNNKTIRSIAIPASIESVGAQAFYGSVLNEFTSTGIGMQLKSIGEEAFKDCKYLTDMYYCDDIKVIEKGTFENCSNLKQMSSQNVIEIKESAFRNCKNLTFYLDGSLERIGDYAFENVHEVNDNGYYFENPQLSYIGKNALKGCQNESFNFKAYMNLNELPSFEGCSKLTSITLPQNVKQIPVGIFEGCTSLAYVYMSENIEYIAENAFSDCNSLYYLYIPVSKTPEVFNNSFSDLNYQLTKLAVPADYLPFYKNHPVWGKFSVIEPIGQASTYPVEIFLSEGGSMKFRVNKDEYWQDFNSSYYGTFDSASRIEFFVSPSEGYSIESVYLNGENITESLNDNNGFVIPYLLENTSISVKFKKKDVTSIDSVNADRYIYSIGSNQLILQGFKVGSLIHVYETSGRLIFRSEVQNNEEKIELPNKGIYFIRIGSENIKIAL